VSHWPAGDALIESAWLWIGVRYQRLPEPRPSVSGPQWTELEDAINFAYETRSMEVLRPAIRAWAAHALTVFKGDNRGHRGVDDPANDFISRASPDNRGNSRQVGGHV
jgi:hypothetical protein